MVSSGPVTITWSVLSPGIQWKHILSFECPWHEKYTEKSLQIVWAKYTPRHISSDLLKIVCPVLIPAKVNEKKSKRIAGNSKESIEIILEQTLFCTTFPNFDLLFNFSAQHKTSLFRLAAYKIQRLM